MRRLLAIVIVLWCGAVPATAQIARDTYTPPTDDSNADNSYVGFNITTAGSDLVIVVGCLGATTDKISDITIGGVSSTLVGKLATPSDRWAYLFYRAMGAMSGSTAIGGTFTGNPDFVRCSAVSYTGIDQTCPLDQGATNSDVSTTLLTTSVNTVEDNDWLVGYGRSGAGNALSAGTGTLDIGSDSDTSLFDSNGPTTPAGSDSLIITHSAGSMAMVLAAISPTAAICGGGGGGGASGARLLLLGVGGR